MHKTQKTTMTGTAKGDPSGIGGSAAIMPTIARVAQESAAAAFFFLFTDSLAGSSGRARVSRAGMMSAVRAVRSAYVRDASARPGPQVELVPVQPSLHERGLEHLNHLLAVSVRGPQATAAAHACRYLVTWPCHPGASPQAQCTESVARLPADSILSSRPCLTPGTPAPWSW